MAVYDRWHRDPAEGDQPCKCGKGRKKLYPSAVHLKGSRWQVRWDDPNSESRRQPRRNFDLLDPGPGERPDPEKHASAFDAVIQGSIVTRTYADPNAGDITLKEYAEEWRSTRGHGHGAAVNLESRLRNHVYEGTAGSGRTPRGGVAIGQRPMGFLEKRPTLLAAWVAAMPLGDGTKRMVIGDVSSVFNAAMEDGVVRANPLKSSAVTKPPAVPVKAAPYSADEIAGITAGLDPRFRIVTEIGTVTAMRKMEMAGFGADDIIRGPKPKVRVLRQLVEVEGELFFGPLKNRKPHDVPVPKEFIDDLDAHMKEFPPLTVTLPWHQPGSKLHGTTMTVRLVLSPGKGVPAATHVMAEVWEKAVGDYLEPKTSRRKRNTRGYGIHRTRHTAVSRWLREGIDVVRVAAWIGDTPEMVMSTYAHLMPDDHDGDEAGRSASAAFLRACALAVPSSGEKGTPRQLRAVGG